LMLATRYSALDGGADGGFRVSVDVRLTVSAAASSPDTGGAERSNSETIWVAGNSIRAITD
jgi:hypothetical protein